MGTLSNRIQALSNLNQDSRCLKDLDLERVRPTKAPTKGDPTTPATVMEDTATPTPVDLPTTTLVVDTVSTTVAPRAPRPLEGPHTPPTTTTTTTPAPQTTRVARTDPISRPMKTRVESYFCN